MVGRDAGSCDIAVHCGQATRRLRRRERGDGQAWNLPLGLQNGKNESVKLGR